jgi:hypothetical protein
MMRALLIRHPWIDMILDGKKTWEIRGSRTAIRETIGLIPSASGTVVGIARSWIALDPCQRKNLGAVLERLAWLLARPNLGIT